MKKHSDLTNFIAFFLGYLVVLTGILVLLAISAACVRFLLGLVL
jgi:hypothetical protein